MPGLVRLLTTLPLGALPPAARADGVGSTVPEHYLVGAPGGPAGRTLLEHVDADTARR